MRAAGVLLLLAGCAAQPVAPLQDPALLAPHEWDHGTPWAPGELAWVAPPTATYGTSWGPGAWWPSVGVGGGVFVGRGYWWRGYRGGYARGGYRGGYHGGGRRGGRR